MKLKAQEFLEKEDLEEKEPEEFGEEGPEPEKKVPSKEVVIEWFKENPNPSDKEVHKWAKENNFDTHKLEGVIYSLVTEYIESMDEDEEPLEEVDMDDFYV